MCKRLKLFLLLLVDPLLRLFGTFFLQPLITDILDQKLAHALGHVGNVLDDLDPFRLDGDQIGRLESTVEYVGIYLVFVVLDELNELLDFLVVLLLLLVGGCHGLRRITTTLRFACGDQACRGGGKNADTCRDAFVVAGVHLLLVAGLIDALEQVVNFLEIVLLGKLTRYLRVDES